MSESNGSIYELNEKRFYFSMYFYSGMSGSPVIHLKDGIYQASGIGKGAYAYYNAEGVRIVENIACRISWDIYDYYNRYVTFKNYSMYQTSNSITVENVKAFQRYINANLPAQYLGTALTVDGSFGPASKTAAIKLIQYWLNTTYNAGLTIDGSFGPATVNAFRSVVYGNQGMGVYILQGLLYAKGYNPKGFDGSFGVNGGKGCLYAVKYFQSDNNLSVDGRAGGTTFYTLCQ